MSQKNKAYGMKGSKCIFYTLPAKTNNNSNFKNHSTTNFDIIVFIKFTFIMYFVVTNIKTN